MSSMRGIFGVRVRSKFSKSSLSSWVSNWLLLELRVEWADSRIRVDDGGGRSFLPTVGVDCDFSLCSDLFEESRLDKGCCFLFTSSNLTELNHLLLLVLHLLLQGGKRLEKLVAVERWLEFGSLHPKWQGSVGMRIFSVRDVDVR